LLVSAAVAQQVLTESGTVSGIRADGLTLYKGIPFAAPPVGDLRWRPPVPAAAWIGTRRNSPLPAAQAPKRQKFLLLFSKRSLCLYCFSLVAVVIVQAAGDMAY